MTKIKFCGLSQASDITAANQLGADYIGFVFAPQSRRCVTPEKAAALKELLSPQIKAVGVFVDEKPVLIAELLADGIINMAQLHGNENEEYIALLRTLTQKPLIKAFRIDSEADVELANQSSADYVLLDSGAGTGRTFDWSMIKKIKRPYFLAGGLSPDNVSEAVRTLSPFAVDVSSGIETDRKKDRKKMAAFAAAVQEADDR